MARHIIGDTAWQPCETTTNCEGEVPSELELEMRRDQALCDQNKEFKEWQMEQQRVQQESYDAEQKQIQQQIEDHRRSQQEEQERRDHIEQERINKEIAKTYEVKPFEMPPVNCTFEAPQHTPMAVFDRINSIDLGPQLNLGELARSVNVFEPMPLLQPLPSLHSFSSDSSSIWKY